MMRAMFSGVSGLKAHQTELDIIGNNISNVNTVGYKSSRVTFKEVFSQTVRGASAPDTTTGRGGSNPMQIGLGMGVAAVDTLFTRGSDQKTDNPTDLAIEGEGFFIVRNGNTGSYNFTRAGNFSVDTMGNLVASNGMNVYGWQNYTDDPNNAGAKIFDTEKNVEPINLYSDTYNGNKKIIAPKSTDSVALDGNLNMNDTTTSSPVVVPVTAYDSYGNEYKIDVQFKKSATDNVWNYTVTDTATTPRFANVSGTLKFDAAAGSEGKALLATGGADAAGTPVPPLKRMITLGLNAVNSSLNDIKFELDMGKMTQYATDSSAKTYSSNGYNSGTLTTFNIGSDGVITGIYSNGKQQPLGMVGLASFENPSGLQKVGDNMYMTSTNSGDFKKGVKPGTDGTGTFNAGTLEMSNVDLSQQFTDMITTQRGFQANSKIITTADEILNELVNMKR